MTRAAPTTSAAVTLDGREHELRVLTRSEQAPQAPRLVVVSFLPSRSAFELLATTLRAIQALTPEPHELWVVDNASPEPFAAELAAWPGLNLVLNRTVPAPPGSRERPLAPSDQERWGSYANAIGLGLVERLLPPPTERLMSLHMDAAPCRRGWLGYLLSKLVPPVGAVGVRLDRVRDPAGVLHASGLLVDLELVRRLGLDFLPRLPLRDTGDEITAGLRRAGFAIHACRNTLWEPALALGLEPGSALRELAADRALDDQGEVIFAHLGRGLRKAAGAHPDAASVERWHRFFAERTRA